MKKYYTEQEVIDLIKNNSKEHGQNKLAYVYGISNAHMSEVLQGKKNLSHNFVKKLGFEVIFKKV